jgi:cysteinyl-tRNA synthetase
MLQSHYSSTLDFSNEALASAEKGFKKLSNSLGAIKNLTAVVSNQINAELVKELNRMVDDCYLSMSDDFNSAKAIAGLFVMSARINDFKSGNTSLEQVDIETFEKFKSTYVDMMEKVLGLKEETDADGSHLDGVIQVLIELRKKARTDRNYALSDKIRDDLQAIGVQLKDGKNGEISYTIE